MTHLGVLKASQDMKESLGDVRMSRCRKVNNILCCGKISPVNQSDSKAEIQVITFLLCFSRAETVPKNKKT